MCLFKKKKKEKPVIVEEQVIIRPKSDNANVVIESIKDIEFRTDVKTYISVPSNFEAIVDIEGERKSVLTSGLHRINFTSGLKSVHGSVCYVNHDEVITTCWGTEQYDYVDSILQMPIRMAFRGTAKIRIAYPEKFVSAVLGRRSQLTVEEIDDYFTKVISTQVIGITADVMINCKISYVEFATLIMQITAKIGDNLKDFLRINYGIETTIFTIEPPFYADRTAMETLAKDLEEKRRLETKGTNYEKEYERKEKHEEDVHRREIETIKAKGEANAKATPSTTIPGSVFIKRCAFCGNILSPTDTICPKCGKKTM